MDKQAARKDLENDIAAVLREFNGYEVEVIQMTLRVREPETGIELTVTIAVGE